ncbi:ABC transporter permease [Tetragenococcus halophilus]|uniref:ABC transporter permease n=1 Tax=Tetragenococcus halophilus TaxID=51669 RepID=UPI001F41DB85|nr:ABC transporter permease [Tetragenococcus halophilus]MCF1685727.1 ABC transporter permease [Tetragenococcus halophilus]
MKMLSLIDVEFRKIKRSKILFILFFAMLVVWFPSLINVDMNFAMENGITPEHNLFIQGLMAMVWFIYPASMIVVTLLINQNEKTNHGLLKMLSLPIDPKKLSLAKFVVLFVLAAVQLLFTVIIYYIVAYLTTQMTGHSFMLSPLFIFKEIGLIYLTSLPMLAFYWLLSVIVQTPIFAIGIGLATIVPSVLMINSQYWYVYPFCYPYYMVVSAYGNLAPSFGRFDIDLFPWILIACMMTICFLILASVYFGKKERQ